MIKWSDVKVGVSPLSNTIYMGKTKPMKGHPNISEWVDRSGDKTEEVMIAVIEWFIGGKEIGYQLKTKDKTYTLSLEVTENNKENNL